LENGKQITQSTATSAIALSLELLDVQPGMRILEIGTGSGYSTALLAYLVGCNGSVVSIDIDPEITKRAKALFQDQPNVSLFTGYAVVCQQDNPSSTCSSITDQYDSSSNLVMILSYMLLTY
jgi:protein-L-isoaspartate O-methyltransferase